MSRSRIVAVVLVLVASASCRVLAPESGPESQASSESRVSSAAAGQAGCRAFEVPTQLGDGNTWCCWGTTCYLPNPLRPSDACDRANLNQFAPDWIEEVTLSHRRDCYDTRCDGWLIAQSYTPEIDAQAAILQCVCNKDKCWWAKTNICHASETTLCEVSGSELCPGVCDGPGSAIDNWTPQSHIWKSNPNEAGCPPAGEALMAPWAPENIVEIPPSPTDTPVCTPSATASAQPSRTPSPSPTGSHASPSPTST
jgi:hypothetical protein